VFGARGFVGQRLLALLRSKEGDVCFGADLRDVSGGELLVGDIRDSVYVEKCFQTAAPDVVVHLASYGMSGSEMANKKMTWDVNENGTRNVAQCCERRPRCRLIYISTVNVCFNGAEVVEGREDCPYVDPASQTDAYRSEGNACVGFVLLTKTSVRRK
jgi:nucleoside-diphosphate-sugar epimerase